MSYGPNVSCTKYHSTALYARHATPVRYPVFTRG